MTKYSVLRYRSQAVGSKDRRTRVSDTWVFTQVGICVQVHVRTRVRSPYFVRDRVQTLARSAGKSFVRVRFRIRRSLVGS